MATVVVTGANGFIGTNLLDKLLRLEPTHLGLPQRKPVKFLVAGTGTEPLRFLACDLTESLMRSTAQRFRGSARVEFIPHTGLEERLAALSEPPLAVIHNGACSSTTETNPEVFATLNVGYSQFLWEYCARQGVPFLYASSAAVYGDGSQGFSDKKEDSSRYKPLNLYGKSKLDFDLWALAQSKTPPVWFGLRYFNVYGPFEAHKGAQASMVYHGYQQITRTGSVRLFKSNLPGLGDGEQQRDFVWVHDVVEVTYALLQRSLAVMRGNATVPQGNGCFVNVGRGQAETWNSMMREVFQALSLPIRIDYIDMPENLARQYQNYTCADLSTFHSLNLGVELTSLGEGVRTYVQRYLMRGL